MSDPTTTPTPTEPQDVRDILDGLCRLDDEFGLEPADVVWVREQARKIRDYLAAVSAAAPDERDEFDRQWAQARAWREHVASKRSHRQARRSSFDAGWEAALAARPAPVVSGADVDGLSVAIRTWHDATFPGKTNAAVALKMAEEAGEVAGAQVRCDEIADGHRTGDPTAAREHLAKELGDLAIVWLTLCARHDLAPEAVVRDRWATVQNRRWTTAEPEAATVVGTKRPCARVGFEEMWDGDRWVPICLGCGDEAAYCDGTRHRTVADAPAADDEGGRA